MKKEYKVVVPGKPDRFEEEVESCLQQLSEAGEGLKLFKLVVFLDSESETDFFLRREFVRESIVECFKDKTPTFSILSQKPEPPFNVLLEAGFVVAGNGEVVHKKSSNHYYTLIKNDEEFELWSCGNGNRKTTGSTQGDAERAFKEVLEVLEQEGMTYDNVVRQWSYIGEILKVDRQNGRDIQNYQLFNEVRNQYFKEFRTKKEYPAATGIGKAHRGVSIDFCAIKESPLVKTYSIDNEKQKVPYAYAQCVLVGASPEGKKEKQAPQFERAKLITAPNADVLFLSGTASIIGEETIGVGNLEKQTKITAQHLNTLQGYQNLSKYCQSVGFTRGEYVCLRVYVKNTSDMRKAKMLCVSHFGESVPMAFVLADVCRDNLLIEIEGEVRL